MKRNSTVSALLVLAAVAALSALATVASAVELPITRPLPCKRTVSTVAGAYVDSLVFTIQTRSTSEHPDTLIIDTSDWDWTGGLGASASTSSFAAAYLNFTVGGTGAVASGIDSLFCQYQTSENGVNYCPLQALPLATWNNSDTYARIPILADSDALNASAVFGQRYIRVVVCGDTGGKLGQVSASVKYWPKGDQRVVNNPDASFR